MKNTISLKSIIAAGAGLAFATATYVPSVQISSLTPGNSAWIFIVLAGFVCILASFCFSELVGMYPTAAGVRVFIQKGINDKIALIYSIGYFLGTIILVGIESYILSSVMETLLPSIPGIIWIVGMLVIIGIINHRGVVITTFIQDVFSYFMFTFLIIISFFAIFAHEPANTIIHTSETIPFGAEQIFGAIGLGVFLFMGFEWITPLIEETDNPKNIYWGMIGSVILLTVCYALFNYAMNYSVSIDILSGKQPWTDGKFYGSRPHIVFVKAIMGEWESLGLLSMGFMSILASVTSFNAGVLTVSKFSYALSREKILPKYFSKLHLEFFSPYAAIWIMIALAIISAVIVSLTHSYKYLPYMGAAIECLLYTLIAASVFILRTKEPNKERPFKLIGGKITSAFLTIFFFILFLGIFTDGTQEAIYGFISFIGVFTCTTLYVIFVVPRLKAKK